MVFEDVTALELHLHVGDEDTEDRKRPVSRRHRTEVAESKSRKPLLMAAVMVVVSIVVSIGVTLLVRKFRSWRE